MIETPNMPDHAPLNAEGVNRIVKESLEKIVSNEPYKHSDVSGWNDAIVESVVQQLVAHEKAFKYIVTSAIMQKNGAGLNTAATCFWDTSKDRYYDVRWENKHLYCFVNVFALPHDTAP